MPKVTYSVIVTARKVENTLPLLVSCLNKVIRSVSSSYEIVLWMILARTVPGNWCANSYRNSAQMRIMRLNEKSSQLTATTNSFKHSSGRTAVTPNDKLQFCPDDLPATVEFYNNLTYRLVFGVYKRKVNSKILYLSSEFARFLFHKQESVIYNVAEEL